MNLASKKLSLVVASTALVLASCSKKPVRPNPSETMIGMRPGGADVNTLPPAPSSANFNMDAPGLTQRGPFDQNGENREALQAQTIYFEFDQSAVKASERPKLKLAKEYLDKNPTHRLVLEGRCDWRGTAEYNLGLGDRRAAAAKKYLQTLGVAADRLETRSKGSLEASKNADEATMAKDRRVELIVVDPSAAGGAPRPISAL
jgi:peptidoglycan-associated lipoprotein